MDGNMRRVQFSDPEPADDGGVELSLGLSIGGSSRRASNPGPARHGSDTWLGSGEAVADFGGGLRFDGGDPFRRREGRKNGIFGGGNEVPSEDQAALEAQALKSRARDRAAREREALVADQWRQSDGRISGVARIPSPNPNPVACGSHPFPAMAMQYSHHHVQYAQVPNGLGYPVVMPCWAPAVSPAADEGSNRSERNVFLPVACRGLPVSVPALNANRGIGKSCSLDVKGGNGIGVNGVPSSIDSLGSSSSGVSDHWSGSFRGSSISSDARSHSTTHTMAEKSGSQLSSQVGNLQRHQSHHAASSSRVIEEGNEKAACTAGSSLVLNSATSTKRKLDGVASVNKPISAAEDWNLNGSFSLPRMPYVSATGDGPNGKTVTGFLYRYTKSEVSIVCVCHGSSFSPAEFVRHAGGTNISHPLRQIIVVPS
ncbi:uncharacterized protein LOC120111878 [Phoenix dactylifera]|uniref:Ninja-family protein n=1 Tax=Phoenix dactylifera TaxID=42345 RepID=A0A8B9AGP3_PHODC|nr:uncharacterized protein LOC120111878 [Phoenix dactylifera]